MKTACYIVFLIGFLLVALPAFAADAVAIKTAKNQETLTITLPHSDAKVFTMDQPNRLVVDIYGLRLRAEERKAVVLPQKYKGRLIKTLRVGQFDADTVRLVFDLQTPVEVARTSRDGERVVIEISPANNAAQDEEEDRQPLIVIDPGHGGQDPGTIAADGTHEKDLVLEYAKALRTRLQRSGEYQVALTREDDQFVMLRKRFAIARKEKASLFISLHADSAPEKVRGLSVYTLSEKSSDEETEALAARENKSDILAEVDLSEEREDVADILISLAQRETMNNSAALADYIVAEMEDRVELLPNTHRFAGFAVLKAPDVPSVLVEVGFLSHPKDSKLLKTKAYREKVVDGIADGVDAYFKRKRRAGRS